MWRASCWRRMVSRRSGVLSASEGVARPKKIAAVVAGKLTRKNHKISGCFGKSCYLHRNYKGDGTVLQNELDFWISIVLARPEQNLIIIRSKQSWRDWPSDEKPRQSPHEDSRKFPIIPDADTSQRDSTMILWCPAGRRRRLRLGVIREKVMTHSPCLWSIVWTWTTLLSHFTPDRCSPSPRNCGWKLTSSLRLRHRG